MLAYFLQEGRGVEANDQMALRHFLDAAVLGDQVAQYELGFAALSGRGMLRNGAIADAWLNIAASSGYVPAMSFREENRDLFSQAARDRALVYARECVGQGFLSCELTADTERLIFDF